MSDDRSDPELESRLRAAFARARVPAAPASLRGRVDDLAAADRRRARGQRFPFALLAAAALLVVGALGGLALVGSTPSPSPSPAHSAPSSFVPPGPMGLFVADQPTAGDGWRILGGAPNLPGPSYAGDQIDLYEGAALAKPLDVLGLPPGGGSVDPAHDVIAVADILVGSESSDTGCGRIRLDGVTFDKLGARVTVRYRNAMDVASSSGATPVACPQVGVPARFVVALSVDHLPTAPFTLQLRRGDMSVAESSTVPPPPSSPGVFPAAIVDEAGTFPKGGLWVRQDRILRTSSDGGRSWQLLTLPADPIAVVVHDPASLWIVSAAPGSVWPYQGGGQHDTLNLVVSRTADGGETWASTAIDGNAGGLQPVLGAVDARHGYLLLAAYRFGPPSRLLETLDDGATWREVPVAAPAGGSLGSVFTIGPDGALWAGSQGDAGPVARPILALSRDGGRTWADAALPDLVGDVSPGDRVLAAPAFFGSNGVVAVSGRSDPGWTRVFRTSDSGRHWSLAAELQLETWAFASASPTDWAIATARGTSVSADGGATWSEASTGSAFSGPSEWLGFAGPGTIAAVGPVGGNDGASALLLSGDGGRSWRPAQLPGG